MVSSAIFSLYTIALNRFNVLIHTEKNSPAEGVELMISCTQDNNRRQSFEVVLLSLNEKNFISAGFEPRSCTGQL